MIKKFDSWEKYRGASEGSGRSEKIWLENPDNNRIGLFKFRKSQYTTEHFSEKLASEIASIVGLESADVEIGKYNSRIGTISYRIVSDEDFQNKKIDEKLIEGIRLINKYYPEYNKDTLYDKKSDQYYSLKMIKKSLEPYKEYNFFDEILKMMIFDFFIGNTDRHHSNWALIQKDNKFKFCPLYDNGSSLCCYLREGKLEGYLGNDHQRFMALIDSKSTSRIRIDGRIKKEPQHTEVLEYINNNYYYLIDNFVNNFISVLDNEKISDIVNHYGNKIISDKRKELIIKYLYKKREILINKLGRR